MDQHQVSLVKCTSYDASQVESAVRRSIDLLGGIERFVKPGEKVLLKPNLLADTLPENGITTHPEVLRAVIRVLKPVTSDIMCGDSPSVWGERIDLERVYGTTGVKKVCAEEGVRLVYLTTPKLRRSYPLTDWLEKCDRLISIPKFKTHSITVLTAGIKNLFGLVVGMYKLKIHFDYPRPEDLSRALVDLYEICSPDLTILDGIVAMEGDGPGAGGTLRPMNLIAASPDALSMDMILAGVMGVSPSDIPTNKEAVRRGLGPQGSSIIEVLGEELRTFCVQDFLLPKTPSLDKAPKWLVDIFRQSLKFKVMIRPQRCKVCGLCLKGCPAEAMAMESGRIRINDKKCLRCLCCQEVCPHGAISIEKSLLFRMFGLLRR
jgi:uncharacterized protein (DUF362 family)/Pyruvate/2-oxoacid:ferredoxin oxidoreductase delta subunit